MRIASPYSMRRIGALLLGLMLTCIASCDAADSQRPSNEPMWQHHLGYLQREAEAGNPKAELWLAWANAIGKTPTPKMKFEWLGLSEAHHAPWTAASELVASRQFDGNPEEAWRLLKAAMHAGEPRAKAMFANILATGRIHNLRAPKDSASALLVALQAAEDGDLLGMQVAAWLYALGPRSLQDHGKGVELATRAADRGYILSKVLLGMMDANGVGANADPGRARRIAEGSAESGHPYALAFLAYTLQAGIGGPKKLKEAFTIAGGLAGQGSSAGMLRLGDAYFYGWGVAEDKALGVEWWKRAGAAGAPAGYQAAGNAYLRGDGVPQSRSSAWLMFTLSQQQFADQPAIEAWAGKYRNARRLNTHQWLRNLRGVRVSGVSMNKSRSNQQVQRIADLGVRHYHLKHPLKVDPDADVELRVHLGSFAIDGSRHNMAFAFSEFHTVVPVLMRGEFINTDVVVQYGISVQPVQSDLSRVYWENKLAQVAFYSLKTAMNVPPPHGPADASMDRRFKKELWPPDQDRKMYVKYQVARSFGREAGGFPLAGFSAVSDPVIRIFGGGNVREWKLKSEWQTQLERYGIGPDEDSPNFIAFDVIVQGQQVFNPEWNMASYASFKRQNVVFPLPDGRLARWTVGLVTSPGTAFLKNRSEAEDDAITTIQRICETVGPSIQAGVKAPLTPRLIRSGMD